MKTLVPTARSRLRRRPQRGHYDRDTVYAILDAGFVCHVGYAFGGQPYVTPTCYWREGDSVYWHGSSASRMLRHLEKGVECCLAVTHVDALVLARSGFHHSINYRSAMLFGRAHKVLDARDKLARMEAFVERVVPGRWKGLRPVTQQELRATTVLGMRIEEASAKIRTGPPVDDEGDYALPVWAGTIPVFMSAGHPQADPKLGPKTMRPRNLASFEHLGFRR